MKNRWDALKSDFTTWKTLLLSVSGLGRDPRTSSIAASDEWWEEKIEAMPACKKFRLATLENEEDLEIMFSGVSYTNAYAMAPGAKEGLSANDSDDVEEVSPSVEDKQARKRCADHKSPIKNQRRILEICSSSVLWIHLWKKLVQASLLQHLRLMIILGKR